MVAARAYAIDINQFNFFTYSRNYNDLIDAVLYCKVFRFKVFFSFEINK